MKYIFFISIIFVSSSCEKTTKEEKKSFKSQIIFIVGNENISKFNTNVDSSNFIGRFNFIYFVDGGCDLCSLDLSEVENLRKSLFSDYIVKPIVIIYGNVNIYTLKLIKDKDLYNYSIYALNYNDYDSLMIDFNQNTNSLIVDKNGMIKYSGNPLTEKNDMNRLLEILKQ
ncbi:hypothetical protein [Gracilimonas sp.]|uniref:hypothetical protein n=1 Tax=Gracilimonas sp. TaxID=1974203 RepID=UPI00287274AB|nr:hypothetical protein [Gracilimonas sp.]